jgi:hypothetical protein
VKHPPAIPLEPPEEAFPELELDNATRLLDAAPVEAWLTVVRLLVVPLELAMPVLAEPAVELVLPLELEVSPALPEDDPPAGLATQWAPTQVAPAQQVSEPEQERPVARQLPPGPETERF